MASKNNFFNRGLNLVADYQFNNNLIDDANGITAVATNQTYRVGDYGNEIVFRSNPKTDLSIPYSVNTQITDGVNDLPFRIEFGFKIDVFPQFNDTLFDNGQFTFIMVPGSQQFRFSIRNANSQQFIRGIFTTDFIDGTFYKLVVTYDGSKEVSGLKVTLNEQEAIYSSPGYIGADINTSNVVFDVNNRLVGGISYFKMYK